MSDGEYDMEWDDAGDGGDGWDSDPGAEPNSDGSNGAVEIENNYYEAEGNMKDAPEESLERFETVVALEEQRDECNYSFNAHK